MTSNKTCRSRTTVTAIVPRGSCRPQKRRAHPGADAAYPLKVLSSPTPPRRHGQRQRGRSRRTHQRPEEKKAGRETRKGREKEGVWRTSSGLLVLRQEISPRAPLRREVARESIPASRRREWGHGYRHHRRPSHHRRCCLCRRRCRCPGQHRHPRILRNNREQVVAAAVEVVVVVVVVATVSISKVTAAAAAESGGGVLVRRRSPADVAPRR